jgi:hypothetical protein
MSEKDPRKDAKKITRIHHSKLARAARKDKPWRRWAVA